MRPIHLRMKGFRSFREECELRFDDLALFAIVGETGAGKSSILQAICYALYGRSTFDGGSKALIHGAETHLTVALTFEVRGERWYVERSTGRAASPAPNHALRRDDDAPETRVRGERAVNEKIASIIGLSFDAFTRSVLLPQGEFQRLLIEERTKRLPILKQVLGLGRLDRLRELLKEPLEEARRRLQRIDADLAACGIDVEQRLANQEAFVASTTARVVALRNVHDAVAREQLAIGAADQERASLRRDQAALAKASELRTSFDALRELETAIDDDERTLLVARTANVTDTQTAQAWLTEARAAGRDGAEARRIGGELDAATALRRTIDADEATLAREREKFAVDETQARLEAERLPLLLAAATDAETAATAAQGAAEDTEKRTAARTTAHASYAAARANADETGGAASRAHARRDAAHLEDEAATAEYESATTAKAAAEAALAEVRHAAGLRAYAADLHAGMPCPLCAQRVPDDFAPRPVEHAAPYESARERADTVQGIARKRLDAARTESAKATEAFELAQNRHEEATAQMTRAEAELRSLGESPLDDREREELLTALARERDDASRERERTARSASEARSAHRQAASLAAQRASSLERERMRLEERSEVIVARRNDLRAIVQKLPAHAALDVDLDPSRVAAVRKQLAAIETTWNAYDEVVRTLTEARAHIEEDLGKIEQRRRVTIIEPLSRLVAPCQEIANTAARHIGRIVRVDVLSPERTRVDDELASLLAAAGEATSIVVARDTDLHESSSAATRRIMEHLAAVELDASMKLDAALESARTTAANSLAERNRLRDDAARRNAVQAERAAFAPEADALAALSKLLNDGKFPAFVVARRQTQLLVNAGLILRRMTDDRYALHENFDILDVRLGQVRPANTLSGGETFLASLALALALGEISAAGGGTVDALFLDEGFGTLDDEALVAAVGELQQRSQGGRLIGLVSHVKAVADFVDDVLRVTPGLRGSVIRRMDDAARTLDAQAMLEGLAEPIAVEAAQ